MKKKLLTLVITGILSFTALLGGCGFSVSDTKEIESISAIRNQAEGVTVITITYVDNLFSPTVFEVPDGAQGKVGDTGNGVKEIMDVEKTDAQGNVQRYMRITLTDFTVVELPIIDGIDGTDGKGVSHIESLSNGANGDVSIVVHYTDGTKTDPIPVPSGKNGDTVTISSEVQQNGATKVIFTVTNHLGNQEDREIIIPRGEKGDSVEYVTGYSSADGKTYVLEVKIQGQDQPQKVEFQRPNALLTGGEKPSNAEGLNGDIFFDTANQVIYVKNGDIWINFLDLGGARRYDVEFRNMAMIDGKQTKVSITGINVFNVQYGTFYSNGANYTIPTANVIADSQVNPHLQDGATYEFVGWYTSQTPNFVTQSPFTDLTLVSSHMVLYPVFMKAN